MPFWLIIAGLALVGGAIYSNRKKDTPSGGSVPMDAALVTVSTDWVRVETKSGIEQLTDVQDGQLQAAIRRGTQSLHVRLVMDPGAEEEEFWGVRDLLSKSGFLVHQSN